MSKRLCFALAALACLALPADVEDYPFGTRLLDGGAIVPVNVTMVECSSEPLNFCLAHRFSDNSIRLAHSVGTHTVSERGCADISYDNGRTWRRWESTDVGGNNAYETLDGRKASVKCAVTKELDEHVITRTVEDADGRVTVETTTLKLPFKSWCQLHRNVLRCKDGRLVMPVKGHKEGHSKWMSFMIESRDDGATWQYVSTIMEDPEQKYAEGPNEAELIELANGDLLAYVRVASVAPLHQLRSKDGGRTWGGDREIAPFGVAPSAIILQNGALVVVTGRPGTHLLVDLAGTGESYETYTVYSGSGSSYASVLEIEPNRVLVIYDESDFGTWRNANVMARINALTLDVKKDDSLRAESSDKTMGYKVFYSAADGKLPALLRGFELRNYNKNNGNVLVIQSIAERPHPVLHFEHRGQGQDKWPNIMAGKVNSDIKVIRGELQLRVNDMGEILPQFRCCVSMNDGVHDEGSLFATVDFAKDYILCAAPGGRRVKIPFDFQNGFHTFTIEADARANEYKLCEKGKETPLFVGKMDFHAQIPPGFMVGDGSTDVQGSADLAYVGYTAE